MHNKTTRWAAAVGVFGLAFLGAFVTPTAAVAAEVESITGVTASPSDIRPGEQFSVDIAFSTPEGTQTGDTFTLNVPSAYVSARLDSTQVKDGDGAVIADCASTATTTTCTYTDYVETHANVTGTARFTATANRGNGSDGLDWTTGTGAVFHTTNTIIPFAGGYPWRLAKNGEAMPDGTIRYYSGFPGTVLSPNFSKWTDTYDSRLILNKSTVAVQTRTPAVTYWLSINPSEYVVTFDDANRTFSVELLDPVRDSSVAYRMVYIMQPGSGVTDGAQLNNTVAAGEQTFSYNYTYFIGGGGGGGDQGRLSWTKENEQGELLAGAAFHIVGPYGFDKTIVDNDGSDTNAADGKFGLDHLPVGVYTLTEVTAPVGYKLDPNNWQATVSATHLAGSFGSIVNTPLPSTLDWKLTDGDGNALTGGTFTLEGPDGYSKTVTDNGEFDTNPADGELSVTDLPWGTYNLTQVTGPTGYKIDDTVLTGTIKATQLASGLGALVNTPMPGTQTWKLQDPDGKPLPGGTFTLESPDGYNETITDNGELDTNPADGEFSVTDLPWGDYTLTHTAGPDGYTIDGTVRTGSITTTRLSGGLGTFVDMPLPGTLVWKLQDPDGKPLTSGVFSLKGPNGYVKTITDNGELDTNPADGEVTLADMPWGNYTLTQVTGSDGYAIDKTSHASTVNGTRLVGNLGALVNTPLSGVQTWKLQDPDGQPLTGGTFTIVGPNGYSKSITDNGPLDTDPADGEVTITDLPWGNYTLTHTAGPAGYKLDRTVRTGSVVATQLTGNLGTFIDVPLKNTHNTSLEITGGSSPLWPMIGGLSLVVLGAGAIAVRKKLQLN